MLCVLLGIYISQPMAFLQAGNPSPSDKQDVVATQSSVAQKQKAPAETQQKAPAEAQKQKAPAETQKQKVQSETKQKAPAETKQKVVQRQTQKQRQAIVPVQRQGKIGPQWQVGDQWVVETTSLQTQRGAVQKQNKAKVQWRFTVKGIETISGRECYHVHVTCENGASQQPAVDVWNDVKTGMLVRTVSHTMVKGLWTSFTETYVSTNGITTPVFGAIPALPLDMPLFEQENNFVKSLEPKVYQVIQGESGTKAIDEIGFAFQVDQTVTKASDQFVKSLDDTLPEKETIEVEIKGADRKVRQVWAPGNPWPVYSNNGSTESRLLEFVPAGQHQ